MDNIWILIAFVAYLGMMILIGAKYMKSTNTTEDYFLGGRGLSGWVAALSAQASDMSGWLLMGLPGSIYALGTGQVWIAIGLLIGTVLNWTCISSRLRRYTICANNSLTLPAYFENRYHDSSRILRIASSIFIMVFFLVYTASAFSAGGKLFSTVFGINYHIALTIGAIVILTYTFMGGFMAVCVTDFIQGLLMLIGLLFVPIAAYFVVGGWDSMVNAITASGTDASSFLDLMKNNGDNYTVSSILSQLAWALGYFGMPHILTRFMAIKNETELKKSRVIAIVWVMLSLSAACFIGVVGRAYLKIDLMATTPTSEENIFIQMILQMFTNDIPVLFIGGIFLCGILAAIMSTADSQLLVTASSISEDLYKGVVKKDANDKSVLRLSRIVVIIVAVLAFCIAYNPNSSIMGLVSNAWAGFGATFGPVVLLSLFWKRSNATGAVCGMLLGGLTVIIWDYFPLVDGQTLAAATNLYSLLIGFFIGLIAMIIGSLVTKAPSKEICQEYDDVKNWKVQ